MAVNYTGNARRVGVTCPKCHKTFEEDLTKYPIEDDVYPEEEKPMGRQTTHSVNVETECPHCKSPIEAEIRVFEYPENALVEGLASEPDGILDETQLKECFEVTWTVE